MGDIGIFGIYKDLGIAGAAMFLFWAIASITLHELAHGWAAIWQGDDTPREQQRMTWNPIVHMGVYSLLCLALVGISWGSMPTNPSRYRWRRFGDVMVSGAGPLMNVLLALVCWGTVGFLVGRGLCDERIYQGSEPLDRLRDFAFIGGSLNGMLALFNMLPLPPFDGAYVVAGFSRTFHRLVHDPRMASVGFFIVLVAMFSGISSLCSRFAFAMGATWADVVARLAEGASAIG